MNSTNDANDIVHLPSLVTHISHEFYTATRNRALKAAFILSYNNVRMLDVFADDFCIEASPFVVDGRNGLRMNGFEADLLKLEYVDGTGLVGTYMVRRGRNVLIGD